MVNGRNEKKRNATRSTRRKSERTSPRRSFTVTERGVYIRYLIRDLRPTLNEMNAFTCLLRAYLGASIRPFISSAPLPFSGWLPFLRGHRGNLSLFLLSLPYLACDLLHARKFHGHQMVTPSSVPIFINPYDCGDTRTLSYLFFISANWAYNYYWNFLMLMFSPWNPLMNVIQIV